MLKLEHIGIAVKDLAEANKRYEVLLKSPPYKIETVENEGVITSFFKVGGLKIELLEANNPDSPIAKFIKKRGEGMHHIAYAVNDIHSEIKRMVNEGFELIGNGPKEGADNKLVCFFHPKTMNGVLTELCQDL